MDSALWKAVESEDAHEVKKLLLNGANPCGRVLWSWRTFYVAIGETPLHAAARKKWRENSDKNILELIISSGRVTNINVQDNNKRTPLLYACKYGNVNNAKMLKLHLARVTDRNVDGYSAIHYAVMSDSVSMVTECLTWYPVDVNGVTLLKKTPLMFACNQENLVMVRVLLTAGADVNMKNIFGYTAAAYARDNRRIIESLFNYIHKKRIGEWDNDRVVSFLDHELL